MIAFEKTIKKFSVPALLALIDAKEKESEYWFEEWYKQRKEAQSPDKYVGDLESTVRKLKKENRRWKKKAMKNAYLKSKFKRYLDYLHSLQMRGEIIYIDENSL